MRRLTKVAAVATAAALMLAGCGSSSSSDKSSSSSKDVCKTAKGSGPKVGLAYDVGGRGDQSFNDAAYAGVAKAVKAFKGSCFEGQATDGEAESARENRLTLMANKGAKAIIGVGYAYSDAVDVVAPKFPKVSFAVVDGYDATPKVANKNVAYLNFASNESSYLVGVAAAETSKTGTIGFVGGVHSTLIKTFQAGYEAGAKAAKPGIKVLVSYIQESNLSGFADPAGGKAAATAQYSKGADVVYHASGASGSGVFAAAVAAGKGKWAIGVDSDQYLTATKAQKPHILTSALKRVDIASYDFIKSVNDGSPKTGVVMYDLKNDGVGYSTSGNFIDAALQKTIDGYKQKIIAGSIKVPTTP